MIGVLTYRINSTVSDGSILFTLKDTSVVWGSTSVYCTTLRVGTESTKPLLMILNKNYRDIRAFSTVTVESASWSSLLFVAQIVDA